MKTHPCNCGLHYTVSLTVCSTVRFHIALVCMTGVYNSISLLLISVGTPAAAPHETGGFVTVTYVLVTSKLGSLNVLCMYVPLNNFWKLKLVEKMMASLQTGILDGEYIFHAHSLVDCFWVQYKVLLAMLRPYMPARVSEQLHCLI